MGRRGEEEEGEGGGGRGEQSSLPIDCCYISRLWKSDTSIKQ